MIVSNNLALRPRQIEYTKPLTGGVGIMGMWEFGGICELLFKLLFKLPKVGVGAFTFAPRNRYEVRNTYTQCRLLRTAGC